MAENLKKAAVAQFLESVKSSLNHLSQLKMDLAETGRKPSDLTEKDVMQLYSRVRRLREVLRRWLSAYPTPTELRIPQDDLDLLCSCLVFELNRSDKRLAAQGMAEANDVGWVEKRKEILSYWTVHFASKPIDQLPSSWGRTDVNYEVRQVLIAVRDKSASTGQGTSSGIYRLGQENASSSPSETPVGPPGSSVAGAIDVGPLPNSQSDEGCLVVETTRIRDYRLRLSMVMDLRAYHRSLQSEDFRLAAVLLSMVFEGILIDHGLSHGDELGLKGAPAEWSLTQVAKAVFDSEMTSEDHAALRALVKSRDLLRPALQLEQPMVVNKAMVRNLEKFVRGVAKSVGVAPQSA